MTTENKGDPELGKRKALTAKEVDEAIAAQPKKIIGKAVYGGMMVDKYLLDLEGTDWPTQVPYHIWETYEKGEMYPRDEHKAS